MSLFKEQQCTFSPKSAFVGYVTKTSQNGVPLWKFCAFYLYAYLLVVKP